MVIAEFSSTVSAVDTNNAVSLVVFYDRQNRSKICFSSRA